MFECAVLSSCDTEQPSSLTLNCEMITVSQYHDTGIMSKTCGIVWDLGFFFLLLLTAACYQEWNSSGVCLLVCLRKDC